MPAHRAKARAWIVQASTMPGQRPIAVQGFPRPATGLPMAGKRVPHREAGCKPQGKGVGCWKSCTRTRYLEARRCRSSEPKPADPPAHGTRVLFHSTRHSLHSAAHAAV